MWLLLTVEPNKSHVHKASSKPIITLLFPQYSPTFKTHSLLLPQVPSCSWEHVRCTEGIKGYGQQSRPQNLVWSTVKLWNNDSQDLDRSHSCDYRAYGSAAPPPLPTLTVLASCCQCYVLLGLERLKLALLYNVVCTVVCSQLQLRWQIQGHWITVSISCKNNWKSTLPPLWRTCKVPRP